MNKNKVVDSIVFTGETPFILGPNGKGIEVNNIDAIMKKTLTEKDYKQYIDLADKDSPITEDELDFYLKCMLKAGLIRVGTSPIVNKESEEKK
jgi:hypothetical protein